MDALFFVESLRSIFKEDGNFWITQVESAFIDPELVDEAQHVTTRLVVQLLS